MITWNVDYPDILWGRPWSLVRGWSPTGDIFIKHPKTVWQLALIIILYVSTDLVQQLFLLIFIYSFGSGEFLPTIFW